MLCWIQREEGKLTSMLALHCLAAAHILHSQSSEFSSVSSRSPGQVSAIAVKLLYVP